MYIPVARGFCSLQFILPNTKWFLFFSGTFYQIHDFLFCFLTYSVQYLRPNKAVLNFKK